MTSQSSPRRSGATPKRSTYKFLGNLVNSRNFGVNAKEQLWADNQHAYTDEEDISFGSEEFEEDDSNPIDGVYRAPTSEASIQRLNDNLNAHKKTLYSDIRYMSPYDKMHYLDAWNLGKVKREGTDNEILSLRAAILFLASDLQKLTTITDRLKILNPTYLAGNAAKYSSLLAHKIAKNTGIYSLGRFAARKTGADRLAMSGLTRGASVAQYLTGYGNRTRSREATPFKRRGGTQRRRRKNTRKR